MRLWDVATRRQIGDPLTGHTSPVNSVAFSPDGKTLASGSADGTVRLWDVATRRQIGNNLTGGSAVNSVAFSPDGKTLASGSADDTVRLWDVATGQQIGDPLTGHTGAVNSVAFSPDGKTLASGSDDHTVRLWDVASLTGIATLTGHTGAVNSVAFSPDGKTLASGSDDDTVRLWDVATRQPIGNPLIGHPAIPARSTRWRSARTARPWPAAAPMTPCGCGTWPPASRSGTPSARPTPRSSRPVDSVAFSPDGKTLASGSSDGTVRLWDVATRRQIGTDSPISRRGLLGGVQPGRQDPGQRHRAGYADPARQRRDRRRER